VFGCGLRQWIVPEAGRNQFIIVFRSHLYPALPIEGLSMVIRLSTCSRIHATYMWRNVYVACNTLCPYFRNPLNPLFMQSTDIIND